MSRIENDLPANLEAERVILGAVLLDNASRYECGDLAPNSFSIDSHQRVFGRAMEMIDAGRPVDLVTLANELGRTKEIEVIGGVAYLASLTEGLPRRPVIDQYVRIVKDREMLRQVITLCSKASARAWDQSEDAEQLIEDLDRELLSIARNSNGELPLATQADEAFQELADARTGKIEPAVSSGIHDLDRIIGGFRPRKLYVAGGRPSMGKTSLMIEAAMQHVSRGLRTRLVSLEMTAEELLHRIFAALSEVSFERLTEPQMLTADEWRRVELARNVVKDWPLEIDDRDGQTIDFALAGCRLSCRRRNTKFIALDYAQNLRFTGPAKLRHMELSDAAKRLRQFAKEECVPVLLLSSITEGPDKNPNKRPTLADLRGSGDLAFHADVAILIHRERGEDGASIETRSELIVAKQRGGRTGVAHAEYHTGTLLFEDHSDACQARREAGLQ